MEHVQNNATVLVIDDEPMISDVLVHILSSEYCMKVAGDGSTGLKIAQQGGVDLILLDVMMPVMSGFEVCKALKADPRTSAVPVIFVTAQSGSEGESHGFKLGAADYITKPFSPQVVKARIATQLALSSQQRHLEFLVRKRTKELEETGLEIIRQLGRASELRDCETGMHVYRVSNYSYHIALAAGLSESYASLIQTVAPLHDVGKIGVPDHILLKPGSLTPEEWSIIQTHCELGYQIIGEHENELLKTAGLCAYCHHERWDGRGYPRGLSGEDIPLVARILAVADVFDALTCERPYKRAWPFEAAVAEVVNCAGTQFDPAIVTAFLAALPKIQTVMQRFAENQVTATRPSAPMERVKWHSNSTAA